MTIAAEAATRYLEVVILTVDHSAACRQCAKPAAAILTTDDGRIYQCREHLRLALDHFETAHRLK